MGRNKEPYWFRHGVPRWRQKKEKRGVSLRKGQRILKRRNNVREFDF